MFINLIYFLLAAIGIISALLILTSLNPISRLAFLIIVFIMSAFMFIILDYYFLGLTYIIVYVGAIAILFLFVIMMAETLFTPSNSVARTLGVPMGPKIISEKDSEKGFGALTKVNREMIKKNPKGVRVLELSLPASKQLSCFSSRLLVDSITGNLVSKGGARALRAQVNLLTSALLLLGGATLVAYYLGETLETVPNIASKVNLLNNEGSTELFNFFYPSYSSEFLALSDIQSLGFMIYLAFPFITILLGVLLWCVLIGVLRISGN